MSKPGKRPTPPKPRMNKNRYVRFKMCPMCGCKFATRPKLFEHMRTEYEAEFGPVDDELDGDG